MSKEDIASYKPWYLTNLLTTTALSQSSTEEEQQRAAILGIDNYFLTSALINDKPIYELESYKYQTDMFDSFSPELQAFNLEEATELLLDEKTSNEGIDMFGEWLKYWQDGELEKFEKSYPKKEAHPEVTKEEQALLDEYNNKLLIVRDAEMTEKIEKILEGNEGKTYFIVVGSGHYVGSDGVIANLKKRLCSRTNQINKPVGYNHKKDIKSKSFLYPFCLVYNMNGNDGNKL